MFKNRTIICFASQWDYDPRSKHHVMKALSGVHQVVWVNYRGSRRPRVSVREAVVERVSDIVTGAIRDRQRMRNA